MRSHLIHCSLPKNRTRIRAPLSIKPIAFILVAREDSAFGYPGVRENPKTKLQTKLENIKGKKAREKTKQKQMEKNDDSITTTITDGTTNPTDAPGGKPPTRLPRDGQVSLIVFVLYPVHADCVQSCER